MMKLDTDIRYVKGIGEARAKLLAKLDIYTIRDLVSHFPRDYEDRRGFVHISQLTLENAACVKAYVTAPPVLSRGQSGRQFIKLRIADDTGSADVTFFNQPYVRDKLKTGCEYIFYGKPVEGFGRAALVNPVFDDARSDSSVIGLIVPIYRLTAGISGNLLSKAVRSSMDALGSRVPDYIPASVSRDMGLVGAAFAYENIHFPESFDDLAQARNRLIFEEMLVLSVSLSLLKNRRVALDGIRMQGENDRDGQPPGFGLEQFYAGLPFTPTAAQIRAVNESIGDMCSGMPMNRLVQGDVGSGKTLVAAACIWFAFRNGYQSAFMAPTEILAHQHFATLEKLLSPHGIRIDLLTGSMTAKQKRSRKHSLAIGELDLIIGTHALLSDDVDFHRLALAITDEQHRFGVSQRSMLTKKGGSPHVLVMSATPIPRTLALIIYGDLSVSVIDELPPGRQKVMTYLVDESMRGRINKFMRKLIGEGRQVFVVCPLVDENEELLPDVKSAQEHAAELQKYVFADLRVECIHGKMRPKQKDAIMAEFLSGDIDILVSTTVIEVGVDIPNAALMVIENADRFGLSQLHQLRGRVGRGEHKSYCVMFSSVKNEETRARLKIMCETNDGFQISEADLKLRGPGDFFGSRQHGLPEMKIADLCTDMDLLKSAQDYARLLISADPELESEGNRALLTRINELFYISGEKFN